MKQEPTPLETVEAAAPALLALAVLATAPLWSVWLPPSASAPFWVLPVLVAVATLASSYVPAGAWTLGLGTVALPATALYFGPSLAAGVAIVAFVARQTTRRWLLRLPLRRQGLLTLVPTAADAGGVALAVMGAVVVWKVGLARAAAGLPEAGAIPEAGLAAGWALGASVLYALLLVGIHATVARGPRYEMPSARDLALPLLPDLAGWALGFALVRAALGAGWVTALLLGVGLALLALEAARNVHLRRQAIDRVRELWEVTRAGHRIIFRNPELAGLAEQVQVECGRVLAFSWFQFELPGEDGEIKSWCSGPDGRMREGVPEPADTPPMLPGIHRRTQWKVLGRELKEDGEAIARLRFWCDPRRLEPTSVELLDSLLPQVAASVHRALLDRRAKRDALTGLADRRVLESRLEEVFFATREDGGSMSVIMCDLDRFKRVNDQFGHAVGDRALMLVAEVLETHRRDTDVCCRYGGEEFAVVLEKTDGETAQRVAERLRMELEAAAFVVEGHRIPLRMSAGVASFPELHVKQGRELLLLADEALYKAKRRGRNRSLLHLGRGRFRTADGRVLDADKPEPAVEPPTLFA